MSGAPSMTRRADEEMSALPVLANFALYQLAWLACVWGAAAGRSGIGVAVALTVIAVRLRGTRRRGAELRLILLTGLIGGAWESLLIGLDWVRYRDSWAEGWPPLWIIALWLAFATTLNVSLRWLQNRPGLAALLGLAGGPLAWWAGERFGALELASPVSSLCVIGLGWAMLMPALLALAEYCDTAPFAEERG